ncbi:hypothetical protein Tco_0065871 [Tanacetum coccineum]
MHSSSSPSVIVRIFELSLRSSIILKYLNLLVVVALPSCDVVTLRTAFASYFLDPDTTSQMLRSGVG